MSAPLLIARTPDTELFLLPGMANRHGLITGATGTGKTVTLQKLAESLSGIGVPVFMADVKGDLTGVAEEGQSSEKLLARLKNIGITDWQPHANPVTVWDIFGEKGHPVRATVSDLGPLLLARLLNLNDAIRRAGGVILVKRLFYRHKQRLTVGGQQHTVRIRRQIPGFLHRIRSGVKAQQFATVTAGDINLMAFRVEFHRRGIADFESFKQFAGIDIHDKGRLRL